MVDVCLVRCYGHGCSGRSRRRSVMNGDGFGAGRCAVQARGGAEAAGRRRRRRAAAELLGVVLRAQARVDVADVTLQDVLERRPKVAVEPAHAQTGQSVSQFIICKQKDQTATYTHTHTHTPV